MRKAWKNASTSTTTEISIRIWSRIAGHRRMRLPRTHPEVETVERGDGELSFRVHGLEFARTCRLGTAAGLARLGRTQKRAAASCRDCDLPTQQTAEILYISRIPKRGSNRRYGATFRRSTPACCPRRSTVRCPRSPPPTAGVLDLLAVDHRGRLAVIELKASEDVHLPLQALDYWMRVQWHVERREFQANGYFPGGELLRESPRLLLVSPALDFHPSNERVLRYFSPHIPVERVGVGLEWRKELKVMYRS